jgi:hypothetical protein
MPIVEVTEKVIRTYVYEDMDEEFIERDDTGEIIGLTDEGRDRLYSEIGLSFWDDEHVLDTDMQFSED